MKVNVKHLQPDPKTGILRYRRAFPVELRPYAGEGDKPLSELKISLGSRSLDDPDAKANHAAAAKRYDELVARARKLARGEFDRLDPPLIAYLAAHFLHCHLALDEASRWRQPPPDFPFMTRRDYEADYEESRAMLATYDTDGLVSYWTPWVLAYTRSLGHTFDPSSPAFAALCRSVAEAACQLWLELDKRIDGASAETPPAPEAPRSTVGDSTSLQVSATGPSRPFELIADELLGNTRLASTFTPGVADHIRTALRFIRETLGTPSPDDLHRAAISSVLDLMAKRPVKLTAAERALGLPELAKLYEGRLEVRRMSSRTLEARMSSMSTLWKTAIKEGAISDDLPNPFVGRTFGKPFRRPKAAVGFDAAELTAYFSTPALQKGERPVRGRGEAIYWLPLIALFTGARPEEVAQLILADIHERETDGRWLIRYTDQGTHPVKGPQTLKTERYASGERTFPIPHGLIELGLLDYHRFLAQRGETALFPKLRVKGRRGGLYESFGGWFADYIYAQGVLSRGAERQPVREFRHTWTTAARTSGIARDAREYLQGRKPPGRGTTDEDYGVKDGLADQIDRLVFPIDLVALVPRWTSPRVDA